LVDDLVSLISLLIRSGRILKDNLLYSSVSAVAIVFGVVVSLSAYPAFGAAQQVLCLKCHLVHYEERGSCTACHRGNSGSGRKNIAHHKLISGKFAAFTVGNVAVVREGERLLKQYACRRCHASGKEGGNVLAASLDTVVTAKTPEEIFLSIKKPVLGMPDFQLQDQELIALVNAIYAGAKKNELRKEERPLAVLFKSRQSDNKDQFTLKCVSCHKTLSESKGLLGIGDYGPNLSGLLTGFYPKSFKRGESWNGERLKKWLENPRNTMPEARMQPVAVTEAELQELLEILAVTKH
jgi:cytochrome c2